MTLRSGRPLVSPIVEAENGVLASREEILRKGNPKKKRFWLKKSILRKEKHEPIAADSRKYFDHIPTIPSKIPYLQRFR